MHGKRHVDGLVPAHRWCFADCFRLNAALDYIRCRSELVMENALLRQQLIVLERQITRPQRAKLSRSPGATGHSSFSWQASGLASHAGPVERGTDHCAA